ncbi:MAG TPA: HEAT repeat domain-containing protein [Candidatus Bilamarchaeum sp.]|nr:HEAT repeat domain-containing protein [Candidatus Bilamarchaeum sp.]
MEQATANINKLVSLTFDEKPEIRKEAARALGAIDDPAAVFALVELTYDKDPSVREAAQQFLEKKRQTEPELMSFASIFSSGAKKEEAPASEPAAADAREKMLRPITQIFEKRLGKEKAEMAKTKLMPTIEKVYLNAHVHHNTKKKQDDSNRKVMQEFLTNYLEVMSDLDRIGDGSVPVETHEEKPAPSSAIPPEPPSAPEPPAAELEVVGQGLESDKLSEEISSLEEQEIEEIKEREEIEHLPDTFFKKAYEIMMVSGGDEDMMKQEMNHMIADAQREIGLAFRMARKKFKEMKVTNITKIRDGMRNLNTELLLVKSADNAEYQRTKKAKGIYTRVLVNDESGNEGVVYLFEDRGVALRPGMRIKVVRGQAKTFGFSGETALTLGKKGNVYIVL